MRLAPAAAWAAARRRRRAAASRSTCARCRSAAATSRAAGASASNRAAASTRRDSPGRFPARFATRHRRPAASGSGRARRLETTARRAARRRRRERIARGIRAAASPRGEFRRRLLARGIGTCSVAIAGPSTGTGSRCCVLQSVVRPRAGVSVVAMSIVVLGSTPASSGSRSNVNCSPRREDQRIAVGDDAERIGRRRSGFLRRERVRSSEPYDGGNHRRNCRTSLSDHGGEARSRPTNIFLRRAQAG